MIPLGLTVAALATDAAIQKKIGSGTNSLIISNEKINYIIKIVKSHEELGLVKKLKQNNKKLGLSECY